jgi:DNA-binding transcriptional LysR family regulator
MQIKFAHNAQMNLFNLQLFIEVVRRGSFSAVARDHDMASSSVSRAVASLEEDLGARLLQRTTRRLELTEAGRQYFEDIEGLIEELALAGERTAELSETPRGVLRFTAPATFGQIAIVPLLPAFTRRYPALDLDALLTDTCLDLVADRIDVAVRLGKLQDTSQIATQLCAVPLHVCASPGYLARHGAPARPTELARHDCMHLSLGDFSNWRFRDRSGRTESVKVHSRVVISNTQALKQCALADMGIALLPGWMVERELENGELIALFSEFAVGVTEFEVPVWLLYVSRRHLPLKVRVFVEFIREQFRNGPPWSRDRCGSLNTR